MNIANIEIEKGEAEYDGKAEFEVTVWDDNIDGINFITVQPTDFLQRPAHEIAQVVASGSDDARGVIDAAILNKEQVLVNQEAVSSDNYISTVLDDLDDLNGGALPQL